MTSRTSTLLSAAEPMAIIAMSGRYPKADNLEALWKNLSTGVDAISEADGRRWDLGYHADRDAENGRVYTKCGGFLDRIDAFDAEFFGMSPREARQVDPQQKLLLELTWEAFESAGLKPSKFAGSKTGVFVGISNNDYWNIAADDIDAYSNTGSAFSIASNRISYTFDFHGPSMSIDTACSSSMVAMHQACRSLASGECEMAVVGGVNMLISIRPWLGFASASMLSPDGRCKSFDAEGKGYVRAEGGGILLVKRLADAERDGDEILGVIVETAVNSDGRTMGMAMPSGEAQEQLLRDIYGQAGIAPEDVFYFEAHGTGTAVGDPIECGAIGRVLGSPRRDGSRCLIGSVKSNIGHLESGAGIAGVTKVLLALKHRTIPANLHFKSPNPKIDFEAWKLDVVDKPVPLPDRAEPLVFGINSFGFGGTNAHMILSEYKKPRQAEAAPDAPTHHRSEERVDREGWDDILVLSARTPAALDALVKTYAERLETAQPEDWAQIKAAAALNREQLSHRLVASAATPADAAEKLRHHLEGQTVSGVAKARAKERNAKLALVYSGNGPQWWGMGRELLAASSLFRSEIERIDAIFEPLSGWSLIDEMQKPEAECRTFLTEVAQPLLFAEQVALTTIMKAAGIEPAATFGHSVGEVAAAYACGALTLEQATKVIYHRSQMQSLTAGTGRMAAVGLGLDAIQDALKTVPGWIEVAAVNSPGAVTVAGDLKALETLRDRLTDQGHFIRLLPLDYPFHTKAMDPIEAPLLERLEKLSPSAGRVPFISTVVGAAIGGEQLTAEYWWRNIRAPVEFRHAVEHAVVEHGIDLFVEVGPHPVLRDYIVQTAKSIDGAAATVLTTLRRPAPNRPSPELPTMKTAIAAIHAAGGGHVEAIFDPPQKAVTLPYYPWQRTNFWRGGVDLPDTVHAFHREHPLLGARTPATDGLWTNTLQPTLVPYLLDHVVQGGVVFPAAGYIELALSAAKSILTEGPVDLENFDIQRPFTIGQDAEPIVQVSIDAGDGSVHVRSRPSTEVAEWITHTKARLSKVDADVPSGTLAAQHFAEDASVVVDAASHYAACTRRGLDYGPAFQGVTSVRLTQADALQRFAVGHISLPSLAGDPIAAYRSHPAVLDSCLQILIALIGQNERRQCATLPVYVERVRSFAPLPAEVWCRVELLRENMRSGVANFIISDRDGRIVLRLDGARFQKVEFRQTDLPILAEDWRADPNWQPARQASPLNLGDLAEILRPLSGAVEAVRQSPEVVRYRTEIAPRLDDLASAFATTCLRELSLGEARFTVTSLARAAHVDPSQVPLLSRLVDMAVAANQLVKVGTAWKWRSDVSVPDPRAIWRDLMLAHPSASAELMAIARAADGMASRLRDGAETAVAMLQGLEDTAPFSFARNEIAGHVLRGIVARWPKGRPIRILETNGSTGGLTARILPDLPPEQSDYLFVDPSEAAVARVKSRFADHHFVRAATSISPAGRARFDIVVSSLAHDSADALSAQLSDVFSGLVPGGMAVLVVRHATRFNAMVFAAEQAGMSLSTQDLAHLIRVTGFDSETFIADTADGPARHTIILARRPVSSVDVETVRTPEVGAPSRALIISEAEQGQPFVSALEQSLRSRGGHVSVHVLKADALTDEGMQRLVADAGHVSDFVCLAGWAGSIEGPKEILPFQDIRVYSAILLARVLESQAVKIPAGRSANVTLVTRGATASPGGTGPIDPLQAPLVGLGRVIANEQPNLGCRVIDVHSGIDDTDAARTLADALMLRDDEPEVLLLDGQRYVRRVRRTTHAEQARISGAVHAGAAEAPVFKLDFLPQGGIDTLHLVGAERRPPGAGEIEIAVKAAGLNFRDVLWAMGMLPEDAVEHGFSGPTIGMECAGVVVGVGDGIAEFRPGDRVIAFASSCFSSHVTTSANSAAKIPQTLSFNEAATIPTAFVTAWYALDYLARLEPGETVLIHGAAGGVGLAALQIAKARGAIVIGTAGSADKRSLVATMGADHVLSSRSLKFADDVMAVTSGKGVDVVLNSLAGEAITKGLQILKPFGRFLEIGKRDLYANNRIGLRPFRQNLSYFGIDADTLLVERPVVAKRMFDQVVAALEAGTLRPLPHATTPISRAVEAFRTMQQSRHVGKIVIDVASADSASAVVPTAQAGVRPNATYLVTGGTGGFGLATAEWLIGQGATSIVLASRSGDQSDVVKNALGKLARIGGDVEVQTFAVDIANAGQVEAMLAEIRSTMPPLKGIVHSAAIIEDAPLIKVTSELLHRVMSAKVVGAYNLHLSTLEDDLDLFVMYSSSSALVGNPGQAAYVAANIYLDQLAAYRRAHGYPALSVGWGAIQDAGFLTRHREVEGMLAQRAGMEATPAAEALAELGRILASGATTVAAARFNLMRLAQSLSSARGSRFSTLIPAGLSMAPEGSGSIASALQSLDGEQRHALLSNRIRQHIARIVGSDAASIETEKSLNELGLDSLMVVELAEALEHDIGKPLAVMQLIQAGTVIGVVETALRTIGASETAKDAMSVKSTNKSSQVLDKAA